MNYERYFMEVTVPVRLTEEDFAASVSEQYDKIIFPKLRSARNKLIPLLVICVLLAAVFFYWLAFSALAALSGASISVKWTILPLLLFTAMISSIITLLKLFIMEKSSVIKTACVKFRKENSSQLIDRYTFSADGIAIKSKTINSLLLWDEVYHISEYPSCFTIGVSTSSNGIIPRRCFTTEQELRDFRSIVSSYLSASRWSLKDIPLGLSRPDTNTEDSFNDTIPFQDQMECKYSITFQIKENEAKAFIAARYVIDRSFKRKAVFLAYIIGIQIWLLIDQPLILLALVSLMIFLNYRQYHTFQKNNLEDLKTNKIFWKEKTVSFFTDRFIGETKTKHDEHYWNISMRIKTCRAGLIIYQHSTPKLFIPARAIDQMPDKKEFIVFLKSRETATKSR